MVVSTASADWAMLLLFCFFVIIVVVFILSSCVTLLNHFVNLTPLMKVQVNDCPYGFLIFEV